MDKVRINFAPHAYMYSGCQPGDTRQDTIHVALYTQWGQGSPLEHLMDPNLHGIEECCQSDNGRLRVNPVDFLNRDTLMEVHLHPVENQSDVMAVSPNNCAFLLNLTLPIVNFYIVMVHNTEQNVPKLTILNVTFLNEESLADCAILCALNSEMLLQQVNQSAVDKSDELELSYLKRLQSAIETGVVSRLSDNNYLD